MSSQDHIDLDHLQKALAGTRFRGKIHYFDNVDSTNSLLIAAAAQGAPANEVYLANAQTAGRGRGNHRWVSSPGDGIYLSVLVRSPLPVADALLLSLATGLAAQHAVLESTALELDIRWPNDLMVCNARPDAEGPGNPRDQKKCGGILVETSIEPGPHPHLRYAVIGIGLNVHQTTIPPEISDIATSLYIADRARRDDPDDVVPLFRAPIILSFLRYLDMELTELEHRALKARARLLQRFTACSTWVHDLRVSVPEHGGYTGTTAGLDDRGFLLVAGDDGRMHTVLSGGVRAL